MGVFDLLMWADSWESVPAGLKQLVKTIAGDAETGEDIARIAANMGVSDSMLYRAWDFFSLSAGMVDCEDFNRILDAFEEWKEDWT